MWGIFPASSNLLSFDWRIKPGTHTQQFRVNSRYVKSTKVHRSSIESLPSLLQQISSIWAQEIIQSKVVNTQHMWKDRSILKISRILKPLSKHCETFITTWNITWVLTYGLLASSWLHSLSVLVFGPQLKNHHVPTTTTWLESLSMIRWNTQCEY